MIQPAFQPVDDDEAYEVVQGERVRKPMSNYENVLAGDLYAYLRDHAVANGLGRALIEVMFDLPNVGSNRRPDVSFVSSSRWPLNRRVPRQPAWAVVPELAAEVVSPTDDMEEVMEKVGEYFRAGVTLVWLVLPRQEQVSVYTAPGSVRILSRADELTGDPVVPGFRLPLAELFTQQGCKADEARREQSQPVPPPDPPAGSAP